MLSQTQLEQAKKAIQEAKTIVGSQNARNSSYRSDPHYKWSPRSVNEPGNAYLYLDDAMTLLSGVPVVSDAILAAKQEIIDVFKKHDYQCEQCTAVGTKLAKHYGFES